MTTARLSSARIALLGSIGLGACAAANPALAQDPAAEAPVPSSAESAEEPTAGIDNEIVVTARRRSEVLQDVPIAVTAYTGEQLEREGAIDITDVGDTTPNVTLETSRGTNTTLTAFIRGIGQQDPVAGFEQGVGLYLDDVYLNRPQAAVLDIYDVDRIEILRGPQGTLYGRNTIGGAIKYVTRRLGDSPEVRVRANLGTHKQTDLIVAASTPLGGGNLRVGGSVARLSRGGFGRNLTTGEENYNKDIWATRGTIELTPGDTFFRLSGDYTWDRSNARGGHRLITSLASAAPVLSDEFDTRGALDSPKQKVKGGGGALHAEVPLGRDFTFKSISAYRKDSSGTPIDFDALPTVSLDVPAIYRNKQLSQEFQLLYEGGALNGVAGAYYLDADAVTLFDVRLYDFLPAILPGFTATTDSIVKTKTWAVFGDFTYDITDQFSVSAGGRYTNDKRRARVFRQNLILGGSPEFGGVPPFGDGVPFPNLAGSITSDFEGKRKDTAFTPRASISFKPTDDHHIYASWSKGFKGGGFDPRGQSTQAPDADGDGDRDADDIFEYMAFDPEKVTTYELGWKASLFDRRVSTGIALFHSDYTDMQIPASIGCVVNGQANFCGLTSNAGKARIRGVEFEGNARLLGEPGGAQRLNFGWSLGYLDGEFEEFLSIVAFTEDGTPLPLPGVEVDVADFRKIQNTPKWTASGTLSYLTELRGGDLSLTSTLSYRSKSQQFEIRTPMLDQKGYALLDASAVYELPGGRWTIGVHGKNLTNTLYKTAGYNFLLQNPFTGEFILPDGTPGLSPAAGLGREGVLTAYYGNPRQVFLSVGMKF